MAENTAKANVTETKAPPAAPSKEPEYCLDALRKHCRKLYGISASTFDGATCGLDPKKGYTKKAISDYIGKWLKKEVIKEAKN